MASHPLQTGTSIQNNSVRPTTPSLNLEDVKEDSILSLPSSSSSSPDTDTPNSKCEPNLLPASPNELLTTDHELSSEPTSLVPLEPFVHQVGGHFPMVCLATETICKPLNDREHNFYRTLPGILHPYTPKFEGIMSVALHEDENGYISLMGTPPHYLEQSLNKYKIRNLKHQHQMLLLHRHIQQQQMKDSLYGKKASYQIRMKRTDSLEIERTETPTVTRFSFSVPASIPASSTGSPKERPRTTSEHSHLASLLTETETYSSKNYYFCPTPEEIEEEETSRLSEEIESKEEIFCNPWALKCHRDHLKKLGLLSSPQSSHSGGSNSPICGNNATQLYLLLENLVSKYTKPCVLDLKVGSRQYADDVSAAKKQRKIAKSANTTSASLGLRLCGMQVFNNVSGKYLCHNKYYGRGLSPIGFRTAIEQFLNNSDKPELIRIDIINQLVEKLQNLVFVLRQLESFRFYTSSLLVTYDGSTRQSTRSTENGTAQLVDVRIIDFAHSTHKGLKDSTLHTGPDEGFIYGIENFITILGEIKSEKCEKDEL